MAKREADLRQFKDHLHAMQSVQVLLQCRMIACPCSCAASMLRYSCMMTFAVQVLI